MRTGGDEYRLQKPWSELVSWVREELSLRPLPCQIQRATTGLYVGGLESENDHQKTLVRIAWSSFVLTMRVDLRVDLAGDARTKSWDVKASAWSKSWIKTAVELDRLIPLVFEHVFV